MATATQRQTESVGMALLRNEIAGLENDDLRDALRTYGSVIRGHSALVSCRLVIALVEYAATLHMRLREMKELLKIERQKLLDIESQRKEAA